MAQNEHTRLVLASQSPRRVELLRGLGLQFETIPSDIDEKIEEDDPSDAVISLARQKALAVAQQLELKDKSQPRTVILAADTVVVLGKDILGKPSSREEAYQMLMRMSGRCHRVFTGVCLYDTATGVTTDYEESNVYFRSLDSAEARAYARTEEPMDKAGAYALQGTASAFVERIDGCYTNIIGLPVPLTVQLLRELGIRILGLP